MQSQYIRYIGLAIIVVGAIILINSLHIHAVVFRIVLPAIFVVLGIYFYQRNQRIIAGIWFALAIILFFKINIFGLIVAGVIIFIGYQMLKQDDKRHVGDEAESTYQTSNVKKFFIGEVHYTRSRFELEDLTIQHGIGDVKIDLTKAIIQDGETVVMINGWIGDIDIFVPYDLPVSVDVSVVLGDLEVFGKKEGGVNPQISIQTNGYNEAPKKVKLVLSLLIGDIDVRYL